MVCIQTLGFSLRSLVWSFLLQVSILLVNIAVYLIFKEQSMQIIILKISQIIFL